MKYTYALCPFLLAAITISTPLIAMEPEPVYLTKKELSTTNTCTTKTEIQKLVDQLHKNIQEQYKGDQHNFYFFGIWGSITQECMTDVAQKMDSYYNCIPQFHSFIRKIKEKNPFCSYTLNHLEQEAKKEIENATIDSLELMYNPQFLTIGGWKHYPLSIKKYAIHRAQKAMGYTHDIKLEGHPAQITCANICEATDTAAIGCNNDFVYIYNLKNVLCIHSLKNTSTPQIISFNNDGSQVAAACTSTDDFWPITVWSADTGKKLFNIKLEYMPTIIGYSNDHSSKNQLQAISYVFSKSSGRTFVIIDTFSCNRKDIKNNSRLRIPNAQFTMTYPHSGADLKRYHFSLPMLFDLNTLIITEKKCPALGICLTALQNT